MAGRANAKKTPEARKAAPKAETHTETPAVETRMAQPPRLTTRNNREPAQQGEQGEVRSLIEEINKTFSEFRKANDRRLEELEKRGSSDTLSEAEVEEINTRLTEMQERLDQALTRQQRTGASNDGSNQADEYRTAFVNHIRHGREIPHDVQQRAMSTLSDPDGGYVVSTQMDATILDLLRDASAMRQIASTISVTASEYQQLVNPRGATATWVGEAEVRSDTSQPEFQRIAIRSRELQAQPTATQTLLDDANVDIETWLAGEVIQAFAEAEGDAFISGPNTETQPQGLLAPSLTLESGKSEAAFGKVGGIKTGNNTGLGAANGSDRADKLIDLTTRLRTGYRPNARWIMNRFTEAEVRKIKDADGSYIWRAGIEAGTPSTLLGYPVTIDDYMPDIGADKTPIGFGDFRRAYLIVDRIGTRILRDPYTRKPNVLFYTTKRVGGGVRDYRAYKLLQTKA